MNYSKMIDVLIHPDIYGNEMTFQAVAKLTNSETDPLRVPKIALMGAVRWLWNQQWDEGIRILAHLAEVKEKEGEPAYGEGYAAALEDIRQWIERLRDDG